MGHLQRRDLLFILGRNGQTMLELLAALAVATVIIGSLIALINASNRRATLARQATQASKLAQEGMEIVRNIRDVDDPAAVRVGPCTAASPCSFSRLYESTLGTLTSYLQPPGTTGCGASASWCLDSTTETDLLGVFSRSVEISDDLAYDTNGDGSPDTICSNLTGGSYSNIKRVTVRVAWNSPGGSQTKEVTSCLRGI